MSEPKFMDLALTGRIVSVETAIDQYVRRWHASSSREELHDFLGMTWDEYAAWAEDPDALPIVLRARQYGEDLSTLLRQRDEAHFAMAARGSNPEELDELVRWIHSNHKK